MQIMKKNKLKLNIFLFSVIFILLFIITKLTGNFGRISYGPISFKETIDKIPGMVIASVVILLLGNLANREAAKSEEKSTEAARKRIKEREKKEQQEEKIHQDNPEQEEENNK